MGYPPLKKLPIEFALTLAEKEKFDKYFKDLNVLAIDMESASVAHVCYLYKKPVLIIRSISDCLASPTNQFDYLEFADKASLTSAKMLKTLLK